MISTGVVRPSTIASSTSIAGAHRRARRSQRLTPGVRPCGSSIAPGLADGDHRAGDEHAAGADRLAEHAARLGQRGGLVDGVGQPRRDVTRSSPKISRGDLGQLARPASRGAVEFWVQTTCGEARLERREQALVVLVGHHADHADQRVEA